MADPARRRHPEIEPTIKPQLGVIQGGGESSPPTGNLSQVNPAPGLLEKEQGLRAIEGGGESTPERGNLQSVDDLEKNPSQIPFSGTGTPSTKPASFGKKASLFVRKRAASLTITAVLGVFGIGASIFGGPALLLVHMKEVLTNYGSSASRAADSRFENSLYYRLTGGTEAACRSSGAMSTVKCKRGTMSEKNHRKLVDSGFDVDSKEINGRYIIRSVSKDGVSLNGKSSRANIKAAMAHPDFGSSMRRSINWRTNVFNGGTFSKRVLATWGLDKSKVEAKGDTDEERRKSINQLTGAADEDTDEKKRAKFESKHGAKIKSVGKIGSGPGAVVGVFCSGYNMSRATITAVKIYNAARFASLAILFLKAGDQIKANGEIDPATLALLGGVLTSYATSGPTKGLTATDSQGFKVAAYGGEGALKSFSRKFLLGGNETLIDLDTTIKSIQDKTPGGKRVLKGTCNTATDPVASAVVSGAMCVGAAGAGGGGGFLAGSIVPVIGNAIGGAGGAVTGAAVCTAVMFTAGFVAGPIIGEIFKYILPKVIDYLTAAPIDINKIKGVEAGDGLAAGAGVILEKSNASKGMQPGTKASVTAFQSDTAEDQKNYEMIARDEARSEPFNIYNEYSLLGSLVRKSGLVNMGAGSFATNMSTLSNALFSPARLSSVASAAGSMPVNITAEDLSHCPDQNLKDIGVDCDVVGGTQYTMATDIPIAANLAFMEGKHVDEAGEPISEEYKKWVANCTDNRTDPMGSTSVGIEDEDEWATGEACVAGSSAKINQTTRDHFSTYYYDTGAYEDEDYEPPIAATPGGEAETFTVGTYNLLNADGHTPESIDIAGPDCNQADDPTCAKARALTQSKVIMGESNKYPQMDIVGLQETAPSQYRQLLKNLPTYAGVPSDDKNIEKMTQQGNGAVGVIWNTEKFTKVEEGYVPALSNVATKENKGEINSPWVGLESKGGRKIYVISAHYPVAGYADPELGDKGTIKKAMKLTLDWANEKSKSGTVLFTGDFNDHTNEKTTYCGFTDSGLFQNTHDMAKGDSADEPCPNPTPDFGIDHVYASTKSGLTAKNWTHMPRLKEASASLKAANPLIYRASDHSPMSVSLSFPGTGSSGDLNVGSYNIRTSTLNNRDFGDPDTVYDADDERRMQGAASIITSRQLKIVGVQEVRNPEKKGLMDNLPNYASTPVMNTANELESAVLWDKLAFEQVEGGTYTIPKNPGIMREGMWVKLRSLSTGGEVYVFNMHTSSKVESMRATAARTMLSEIRREVGSSGTPVIVMGDMNSNDKQPGRRAVYDIFKASGILTYTRDAAPIKKGMNCDTENGPEDGKQDCRRGVGSHIDQIWVSKNSGVTVNSWENIATAETLKYSDHNPLIVNLTAPSLLAPAEGVGVGADGWAWPLAADESKPGPCYGTGDPGNEHAGLDINSDGDGKVYAMHDGVVVAIIDGKTGSSPATGNHIMIKTPEGIYYGYQHLTAGSMKVSVNDTVKAGQHIATGGKTGNVEANSKIHLHITMSRSNTTGSYGNIGAMIDPMSVLRSVKPASYECTK